MRFSVVAQIHQLPAGVTLGCPYIITSTAILSYLDEKDLSGEERSGKHLQSKGFYPPASIHDFPLRGKSLILHVRRRRWLDLDTGNPYMRDWEVVAKGTRLTEEFASFLKGTPG